MAPTLIESERDPTEGGRRMSDWRETVPGSLVPRKQKSCVLMEKTSIRLEERGAWFRYRHRWERARLWKCRVLVGSDRGDQVVACRPRS